MAARPLESSAARAKSTGSFSPKFKGSKILFPVSTLVPIIPSSADNFKEDSIALDPVFEGLKAKADPESATRATIIFMVNF